MDELMGSIKLFAGFYAPAGYMSCDGALLPIEKHQYLFSILGTIYGGDGVTNFALPDLRNLPPATDESGGPRWIIAVEGRYPNHP